MWAERERLLSVGRDRLAEGVDLPIIVYWGTAPAASDVAGGHVPMMIEAIPRCCRWCAPG